MPSPCAPRSSFTRKRSGLTGRANARAPLFWPLHRLPARSRRLEGARKDELRVLCAEGKGWPICCDRHRPKPEAVNDGVREGRSRRGQRVNIHHQREMAGPLGARKCVHVANVAGWTGYGPGTGEMIRHGQLLIWPYPHSNTVPRMGREDCRPLAPATRCLGQADARSKSGFNAGFLSASVAPGVSSTFSNARSSSSAFKTCFTVGCG